MKENTDAKKLKEYRQASKNLDICLDKMANAYSLNDCTGLIPREPVSKHELEEYKDIYNYLPTEADSL